MVMLETGLSTAMNAKVIGTGEETIVLAHGYGGDQSAWDKIVPDLAKYFRILVFDWLFSGAVKDQQLFDPEKYASFDAFADDLICLLEEMSLISSPVVFVGHSMSGMIGCIASIKRPELFKRLILVGASPRYINIDDYEGGFKKTDVDDIISNIESNFQNWTPGFASLVVGAKDKDPDSVEQFTKCLSNMKPEHALSVAKTVFYSDEREILDKVSTPCTIVQTTGDLVVPNSVVYYMQEKIKGKSSVEFIDTDGHFPHLTAHQQLLDVLTAVLGLSV
ncbi:strigolactone esterase RMS3 [Ricinus communis]|uniref:Sigma factor sigb regulation protein rsbq, putative n=1 Tax=Ricinus communis TaxID=3988 RepID=B9RPB1_RICCO|nr:strigolactone esterase RMS3 [Ricinus communis]EEF47029.1 sigma factor sigb regulation protein rsbq, putative [Ricinus communis]|eukprot:XP_002515580.1 strigolactone esterase RMS3 [Ricinus communis]